MTYRDLTLYEQELTELRDQACTVDLRERYSLHLDEVRQKLWEALRSPSGEPEEAGWHALSRL